MIGIIVQLAVSWLIAWLFEKGNLSVLGFYPSKRRLCDFGLFFVVAAVCAASGFLLRMYFGKEQWQINPALTASLVLEAAWWNIKSVLFEELIFRGVILYILLKVLGPLKAIVLSAIAFGIYHWFSHEVFGNASQMAITFTTTALMGGLLAFGYAKTFSLYVPSAIHLGWNLTQGFIFSQGPIGNGLFIPVTPQPIVNVSYLVYWSILLIPMISVLVINYIILRHYKQVKAKNIAATGSLPS